MMSIGILTHPRDPGRSADLVARLPYPVPGKNEFFYDVAELFSRFRRLTNRGLQ